MVCVISVIQNHDLHTFALFKKNNTALATINNTVNGSDKRAAHAKEISMPSSMVSSHVFLIVASLYIKSYC